MVQAAASSAMATEQLDLLKLNAKLVAYLGRHEARDKLCRSNTRRNHRAYHLTAPVIGTAWGVAHGQGIQFLARISQGVGVQGSGFRV